MNSRKKAGDGGLLAADQTPEPEGASRRRAAVRAAAAAGGLLSLSMVLLGHPVADAHGTGANSVATAHTAVRDGSGSDDSA